jgi:hypothetical protein
MPAEPPGEPVAERHVAERRVGKRHTVRLRPAGTATLGLLIVLVVLSGFGLDGYGATVSRIGPVRPYAAATATPSPSIAVVTPQPSPSAVATSPPAPSPTAKPTKPSPTASPTCTQGPKHKEVEKALAEIGSFGPIVADGKQTLADCQTIKRFQRRMGISPAQGTAGPTTADVAARIAATDTSVCPAGEAAMACVDLTHQTFYIKKGDSVLVGPTVTRTGMAGFATTAGTYSINGRSPRHWSTIYDV